MVIAPFRKRTSWERCPPTSDLFKDEMIMLTRPLSIALVCVFSVAAEAQLPSERFSPINYFGRFHGFGYSDGYHACKDGRCNTNGNSWSTWKPWESMSSFYDSPTPPPSNRVLGVRAIPMSQNYIQAYYPSPSIEQSTDFSSLPTPASQLQLGNPPAPLYGTQRSPADKTYETVLPAPVRAQPSPSDRTVRELPPPLKNGN